MRRRAPMTWGHFEEILDKAKRCLSDCRERFPTDRTTSTTNAEIAALVDALSDAYSSSLRVSIELSKLRATMGEDFYMRG